MDDAGGVASINLVGGMSWSTTFRVGLSFGGTLSIESLSIDFHNKSVYATFTGDFRGVGTPEGFAPFDSEFITTTTLRLWDFQSVQGHLAGGLQSIPQGTHFPVGGPPDFSLSNLSINQQGYEHIVSALRLYDLGSHTLRNVTSYGVITSAAPEPSTTALLMVGLGVLGLAIRIRKKAFDSAPEP
ncbi:MAG: PEP-CTERM sorting domain-containing protein [Aquabacterium sp.]|uniref:PEP-CTERM sorting domain-containing protein n=1 Tax=Aquabacterium sp. TaxID=1872578 RepID=UPI003BB0491C